MADRVREPIQVYLTRDERAALDRRAQELGVSRSEALRRGLASLTPASIPPHLRRLVDDGLLAPPRQPTGIPPRGRPVAGLAQILDDLAGDRADR